MNTKNLRKMIALSIIGAGLVFTPNIHDAALISAVHAEDIDETNVERAVTKEYTGTFDYPMQENVNTDDAMNVAKIEAIRNAIEQSDIAADNNIEIKKNLPKKEVVDIISLNIANVVSDEYKIIPLNSDENFTKVRASVIVTVDSDKLKDAVNQFVKRDKNEIANIIEQHNEVTKNNDEIKKMIANYEINASHVITEEDKAKLKLEAADIANAIAFNQKLAEGNKYYYSKDDSAAGQSYIDAIKMKTLTVTGEYVLNDYDKVEFAAAHAKVRAQRIAVDKSDLNAIEFLKKYAKNIKISEEKIRTHITEINEITNATTDIDMSSSADHKILTCKVTITSKIDTNQLNKIINDHSKK